MTVIIDDTLVKAEFGTGAVKITPAHDENDYKCGKRHKLEFINILSDDGSINENGGEYSGMPRYHCRNKMEKDLKDLGLFRGQEKNVMNIGFCSRSGDVVEPLLRP
jgi:valyl-tRNA synthetase